MRIASRLRLISAATLAALLLMVPVVAGSLLAFRRAKSEYLLANAVKVNFLERNSARDQYFLHREERAKRQWFLHLDEGDALLLKAGALFREEGDAGTIEELRLLLKENASIFQRIVANTGALQRAGGNREILEELDKRLYSQMLLKAATYNGLAANLERGTGARVEEAYRRLAIIIGLFASTLAVVTSLAATHLARLIRRRLEPLHAGVRRVADGDLDFRFGAGPMDEFGELAGSIDAMTDKLQASTRELERETARRIKAVAAREGEARFRAWFDLPLIGICITSPEKGWLEVNDHLCDMLGYGREELKGRSWADLTHPGDLAADQVRFEQVMRGELEGYALEKRFLKKDGGILEAELAVRCVRTPGGGVDYFVALILDITERRQAEAQRQVLSAQLQQTQKMESLGSLAGGVAHDMNNVLGAILGLATAHLEVQPPESPAHQAFDTITRAAVRGRELVKSLLAFARRSLAEDTELDVNAVLMDNVRILERTTLSRVQLELALAPALRPMRGDPGALAHAFMNLCVNAVDAMPQGGTLALRTRNVGDAWIEVQVEDTGAGMAPEVLEKALDPFFTTKGVGKGTGLGLSLVYSTVKAHRGVLELKSWPGQGTLVAMRFPACEAAPAPSAASGASAARPGQGTLQVLLVDDDELIQTSTGILLGILGHGIAAARSGEEALALLESSSPDVVILDMNMPGLGGAGTLPLLRALRPDVPVLLATGRVDQTALDLVEAWPRVTLMSKPFSMEELQERLGALSASDVPQAGA
ncbi:PAS domain S-box protein [Geothrix sp. 21YS21S-2]|uniref:PAS domain S-box protein n=1 Tax=Geothrix sp. 21YS21S-2 TaxID=3068893 RepID=UPI0027BABC62|nr:PAS domain S-box protein [Geothrix sp. 21YS21S-2]